MEALCVEGFKTLLGTHCPQGPALCSLPAAQARVLSRVFMQPLPLTSFPPLPSSPSLPSFLPLNSSLESTCLTPGSSRCVPSWENARHLPPFSGHKPLALIQHGTRECASRVLPKWATSATWLGPPHLPRATSGAESLSQDPHPLPPLYACEQEAGPCWAASLPPPPPTRVTESLTVGSRTARFLLPAWFALTTLV